MIYEPDKFISVEQYQGARRIRRFIQKLKGKPRFNAKNIMVSCYTFVNVEGRLQEVTKVCILDVFSYNPVVTFRMNKPLEKIEEEDILPFAAMIRQPNFR